MPKSRADSRQYVSRALGDADDQASRAEGGESRGKALHPVSVQESSNMAAPELAFGLGVLPTACKERASSPASLWQTSGTPRRFNVVSQLEPERGCDGSIWTAWEGRGVSAKASPEPAQFSVDVLALGVSPRGRYVLTSDNTLLGFDGGKSLFGSGKPRRLPLDPCDGGGVELRNAAAKPCVDASCPWKRGLGTSDDTGTALATTQSAGTAPSSARSQLLCSTACSC